LKIVDGKEVEISNPRNEITIGCNLEFDEDRASRIIDELRERID
jgi:hypothetical protein